VSLWPLNHDAHCVLNRFRAETYPVEGRLQGYVDWISWRLTDCTSESGNQLIMALSYTQKTSDNSLITKYVRNHRPVFLSGRLQDVCGQKTLYDQFGTYLVQNGLYMASQFSSDSYAGELWNQTNLAVKVWVFTR